MSSRRDDSGPLGHRRDRPHHPDGWHPPRDPDPDPATQGGGRPWRGVRFNTPKDTSKETPS